MRDRDKNNETEPEIEPENRPANESEPENPAEIESELRTQFQAAIESADYPIEDQIGLVSALPNGMMTRFEAGEFSMSAASIAAHLYTYQEFPYESPEAVVDDLIDGLRAEELL